MPDPLADTPLHLLSVRLFDAAKREGLLLCHWKSNARLDAALHGQTDLDVFIPGAQEERLRGLLDTLGFVPVRSRIWSRYPGVSDWLGLDPANGALLHVHLHSRLLTGTKSVKEQDLPWEQWLCEHLVPDRATGVPTPPRALEAHMLLARECVKSFGPQGMARRWRKRPLLSAHARAEMEWLLASCSPQDLDDWGEKLWPPPFWPHMQPDFRTDQLGNAQAFSRLRHGVASALAPSRRGTRLGNAMVFLAMASLKRAQATWAHATGTVPSGKRLLGPRAPIIAIVGSDGAGKSTVVANLRDWLGWKADVSRFYFGTNHSWFRRLRQWLRPPPPDAGQLADVPAPNPTLRPRHPAFPHWLYPIKWIVMAHVRLALQRKAERFAQRGIVVLADRYPQNEIEGVLDGPSPVQPDHTAGIFGLARKYERALFARMARRQPDLILKLVVPLDVALSRRPDHAPELLAAKVAAIQTLRYGGAPLVEIDASQPLDQVVLEARRFVWQTIRRTTGSPRGLR